MNSSTLKNKTILLGVTGGIAAYKSAELIRRLQKEGASVRVVMTEAATRFIPPLTLKSLSGEEVYTDIFSSPMAHIELPREADLYLIAPVTANTLSRLASGAADDMVSACFLAFKGPVLLAPAMNWRMYEHPATQKNLKALKEMGCTEIPPDKGELACGEHGSGRMADLEIILEEVRIALSKKDLSGKRVVVTAGPTRERIDPVRFISNRSSGKMGYALARVARRRGAEVVLISGPTSLKPPHSVEFVQVESAEQMHKAVLDNLKGADLLVMAAAVADYRVKNPSTVKKEKASIKGLQLVPTTDILKSVAGLKKRPFVIGFSAETGPNIANAKRKLKDKKMDMIVFNDVARKDAGFESDTNRIVIIAKGLEKEYPVMSKEECAGAIYDHYLELVS